MMTSLWLSRRGSGTFSSVKNSGPAHFSSYLYKRAAFIRRSFEELVKRRLAGIRGDDLQRQMTTGRYAAGPSGALAGVV